jgi:hypothetical protein
MGMNVIMLATSFLLLLSQIFTYYFMLYGGIAGLAIELFLGTNVRAESLFGLVGRIQVC